MKQTAITHTTKATSTPEHTKTNKQKPNTKHKQNTHTTNYTQKRYKAKYKHAKCYKSFGFIGHFLRVMFTMQTTTTPENIQQQ